MTRLKKVTRHDILVGRPVSGTDEISDSPAELTLWQPVRLLTTPRTTPHPSNAPESAMPGYSGTPLWKKLGIKPAFRIKVRNAPADYLDLLAPLPEAAEVSTGIRSRVDLWHLFTLPLRKPSCLESCRSP